MSEEEVAWSIKLRIAESDAFRELLRVAKTFNATTGYHTAQQVFDLIKRLENKIAQQVGDCPD